MDFLVNHGNGARESGDKWYLAGINFQPEAQKLTLDLSALKGVAAKATPDYRWRYQS